jgi:phosphoenolpyruvate-protein kinase (PTS system EI component)
MIRLTPLAETTSGQELIKNERVAMLTMQIQDKFTLSDKLVKSVRTNLEKLSSDTLHQLIRQILHFDTFETLEQWIEEHLPVQQA